MKALNYIQKTIHEPRACFHNISPKNLKPNESQQMLLIWQERQLKPLKICICRMEISAKQAVCFNHLQETNSQKTPTKPFQ